MNEARTTHALPAATGFAARRVMAALRKRDVDPAPLLRHVGLTERDLDRRQHRISAAAQSRLLEYAAEALNDRAFGLHLALEASPRETGLMTYVAASANNLEEGLALFARYCRIAGEAFRLHLVRRSDGVIAEINFAGVPRRRAEQNAEFGIALLLRGLRQITGRNIHPAQMTLAHERNLDSQEFERFCGCLIEYGASSDRLAFSNEMLAQPLVADERRLVDTLRPIFDEAAKERNSAPRSLRSRVEQEAQELLPHGKARRRSVANNLAMGARTLGRKLAEERTTYDEVVDELRRSLALQYIRAHGISVSQIAWLLGYEGSTAFNHAFRRWTGHSPSAARDERVLPAPAWPIRPLHSQDLGV